MQHDTYTKKRILQRLTSDEPVAVSLKHIQVHGHCVGRTVDDISAASGVHVVPEPLEDLLQLAPGLLDVGVVEEERLGVFLEQDVVMILWLKSIDRLILVVEEEHLGQDIPGHVRHQVRVTAEGNRHSITVPKWINR